MSSPESSHTCDYLHLHTDPHAFASAHAGLLHLGGQISLLDSHISQLTVLRRDLKYRTRQLHNMLLPVYNLPTEVLSYIFQRVLETETEFPDLNFDRFLLCLRRALVLSSVSAHFRRVALCTPDLWKRVPMYITGHTFNSAVSLLQHCTAAAPYLHISVREALQDDSAPDIAIGTILTPGINHKLKAFELVDSGCIPHLWMEKLRTSSFPLLDSLTIRNNRWCFGGPNEECLSFDLGTLNSVTQFSLLGPNLNLPIILPASVHILHMYQVPEEVQISLLYHCPNLVECIAQPYVGSVRDTRFTEPLILNRLKQLTWRSGNGLDTVQSVECLQLPSLEYLSIDHWIDDRLEGIYSLCHKVSTTLTTLILNISIDVRDVENDIGHIFLSSPFPKLEKLECFIRCDDIAPLMSLVCALTKADDERYTVERSRLLPRLKSLVLRSYCSIEPNFILDFLKKWRVGEVSYVHMEVECEIKRRIVGDWTTQALEELRSIVGNRQIEITWKGRKIHTVNAPKDLLYSP